MSTNAFFLSVYFDKNLEKSLFWKGNDLILESQKNKIKLWKKWINLIYSELKNNDSFKI